MPVTLRFFMVLSALAICTEAVSFSGSSCEQELISCLETINYRHPIQCLVGLQCGDISTLHLVNKGFTKIPQFPLMSALEKLNISHNRLDSVPRNIFVNIFMLEILDLSDNNIVFIHREAFSDTLRLQEIYLQNNYLQFVHLVIFQQVQSLRLVNLENNPILCMVCFNCELFCHLRRVVTINSRAAGCESELNNDCVNHFFFKYQECNVLQGYTPLCFRNMVTPSVTLDYISEGVYNSSKRGLLNTSQTTDPSLTTEKLQNTVGTILSSVTYPPADNDVDKGTVTDLMENVSTELQDVVRDCTNELKCDKLPTESSFNTEVNFLTIIFVVTGLILNILTILMYFSMHWRK